VPLSPANRTAADSGALNVLVSTPLSERNRAVNLDPVTPSVPAVERALAILEVVAKSRSGLTLSEIVRELKLPKSSAHCLLLTFERQGYLQRSGTAHRYVCGVKLARIARSVQEGVVLRERAAPLLRDLMRRTGQTVHMAVLEPDQAILIAKVPNNTAPRVATWLGKRMDLHCTALGKCLIAWLPPEDLEAMLRQQGLLRHNENTIVSISRLQRELTRIRETGYAVDDEEEEIGMRCIGVPVFDSKGRVNVAVSVSGTMQEIDLPRYQELAESAHNTAAALSRLLEPFEEDWPARAPATAQSPPKSSPPPQPSGVPDSTA